jgi:hypothetical protein
VAVVSEKLSAAEYEALEVAVRDSQPIYDLDQIFDVVERILTARLADANTRLAAVPRCAWHQGGYPETCWWCGLNRAALHPDPSEAP